jgi:hypothetical protein
LLLGDHLEVFGDFAFAAYGDFQNLAEDEEFPAVRLEEIL